MAPNDVPDGKGSSFFEQHRRDLSDLVALAVSLIAAGRITGEMPLSAALCAAVTAALVPLRPARPDATQWSEFLAAVPRQCAATLTTLALITFALPHPLKCLWFGAIWPVAGFLVRFNWIRLTQTLRSATVMTTSALVRFLRDVGLEKSAVWLGRRAWLVSSSSQERLRVTLLLGAALWLMRGFFQATQHGGADAQWYGLNLADAVAQVRAGVFPLFVGQSLYQFNGALCPIRIAPAFHYLGVLLDLITLRQLGTYALQNLLLVLLGVAGMGTSYFTLRSLLPGRAWLAAGLAALFLSCPGVLGVAYNTDLYMTWTTLPLVPLIWYATVRSFQDKGSAGTMLLLGASLGLTWWGHSPIALWSTFLAGASQVVRIIASKGTGKLWGAAVLGAVAFAAIAAYPVASVLLYPAEPSKSVNLFQHASPGIVVYFLNQAAPGAFLPLSPIGRELSDFQFGYALWGLLLFCVWVQRGSPWAASLVPTAAAAFLLLLLLPLPGLDTLLWTLVPGFVRDVTGNWPMSRIYFPLAGSTVYACALCVASGRLRPAQTRMLAAMVSIGCLWSFSEAAKFAAGSRQLARPEQSAVDSLRPENVQITRYSYSMTPDFPAHPSTFTHGVADPALENRLLSRDMATELLSNSKSALEESRVETAGDFQWEIDQGVYNHATLDTPLLLEPGKAYLLQFEFTDPATIQGVLQMKGPHFFREYGLPEHGGPRSFGAGSMHPNYLPLWTTAGPETLSVRFVPPAPVPEGERNGVVARAHLLSYDLRKLPVRVESWIPYRAVVRSPEASWLETPRVFQSGYRALVDGKTAEVRKSPESLVAVAVPQGVSRVELEYAAPGGLQFLFWVSFISALASFFRLLTSKAKLVVIS